MSRMFTLLLIFSFVAPASTDALARGLGGHGGLHGLGSRLHHHATRQCPNTGTTTADPSCSGSSERHATGNQPIERDSGGLGQRARFEQPDDLTGQGERRLIL